MQRAFLVGCPRSGTTLVQSLVAAHPSVVSFPETHVLTRSIHEDHVLNRLGFVHPRNRRHLHTVLETADRQDLAHLVPRWPLRHRHMVQGLVRVLDRLAEDAGATAWVEKTPAHLHHVDLLMRHVPEARFVHVLRNGPDVVASLHDVTHRHPEAWGGARSLERCMTRWLQDVERSLTHRDDPRHLLVRYEEVTEDPETGLERILTHLDLPPEPQGLGDRREGAEALVEAGETWKSGVLEAVTNRNGHRFHTALTEAERDRVMARLQDEGPDDLVAEPPQPT